MIGICRKVVAWFIEPTVRDAWLRESKAWSDGFVAGKAQAELKAPQTAMAATHRGSVHR